MSAGHQCWCITLVIPSNWMFSSMQRILNQKWSVWPGNLISMWGAFCLMREELIYFSSYERSYTRKQDTWLLFAVISYFNAQNRGTSSPRFYLQEALGVLWTLGSLYLSSSLFPAVSAVCLLYVHIESLTQTPALNMRSFTQLLKPKT